MMSTSLFDVVNVRERNLRRYRTGWNEIVIQIHPTEDILQNFDGNVYTWLHSVFSEFLIFMKERYNVSDQDCVALEIDSVSSPNRPIGISYKKAENLTADVILNAIEKVQQSNKSFVLNGKNEPLTITYVYTKMPLGCGSDKKATDALPWIEFCRRKKSIICIENADNLCLSRSLSLSIANLSGDKKLYAKMRQSECFQQQTALKLCLDANVDLSERGAGIEEIAKFQNYLTEYKITIFGDRRGREIIFEGNERDKYIDIIYSHELKHYNPIISLAAAFGYKYYCRRCRFGFNERGVHRCKTNCKRCHQDHLIANDEKIKCNICLRLFYNNTCFNLHKTFKEYSRERTVCDVVKYCIKCKEVYSLLNRKSVKDNDHNCFKKYCTICKESVDFEHLCYMQPIKPVGESIDTLYVFFDLECTQDSDFIVNNSVKENMFEHVPNLCVTQQCCTMCWNEEDLTKSCDKCGVRQYVFRDYPVEQFFNYLTLPKRQFKDIIILAHNLKSYDGIFLLRYMVERLKWMPELITRGNKINQMRIHHLKFIDSLNFFPMALSKLPKTFNLSANLAKGFFPHLFNTSQNKDYVGCLPPKASYHPDSMSVEQKSQFDTWYDELFHSNYIFNMKEEIVRYCINDVTILRQACHKFKDIFMRENNVDVFNVSSTIASACMYLFRQNFLQENVIGIAPSGGYRSGDVHSYESLVWLRWEERKRGIKIQSADNGREKILLGRKVDGYAELDNGERYVFEYNGCFYHGCPYCFPVGRDKPLFQHKSESMAILYESTERKKQFFEDNGYVVVDMWSCKFHQMISDIPYLRDMMENDENVKPLDLRDAFYGGRVEYLSTYHSVQEGEQIVYLDVCSLYPFCNKYRKVPLKHPKIYIGNECPPITDELEGIVKCNIIPPEELFFPVLPCRISGKLLFTLCRSCAEFNSSTENCKHSDEQRQLCGTWVVDEVLEAIRQGYRISKVHEVWEYEVTCYDPTTKSGGLFTSYVNKFLKMKQEASGWPKECITEEQKQEYIREYYEREGVQLDPEKMESNAGKRANAKLCLNSFWGRFGMREDHTQTKFVKNYDELISYLNNPCYEVKSVIPASEDIMYISYVQTKEAMDPLPAVNVAIAAYTTCMARLHLYSFLKELGNRILYTDTDSIFILHRQGEWLPECGSFLGMMENEITSEYGPGAFIDTFACIGPKSYGYRVRLPEGKGYKSSCKLKGVSNYTPFPIPFFFLLLIILMFSFPFLSDNC